MIRYKVEDVVALLLARKAVEPLHGSPLEATLRESFKRQSGSRFMALTCRWSELRGETLQA